MPVTLAAPCLRRYDLLAKLFASAERGSLVPDQYIVIDTGGAAAHLLSTTELVLPAGKSVILPGREHGRHIGVAAAWNRALAAGGDWTIISNDDVELHPGTIEALVRGAEETDAEYICPEFNAGAMFCVFLPKQSMLQRIGGFDEGFWPAYYEDNDYHRRMKLAGVKELRVAGASYEHMVSATMKSLSAAELMEHHQQFDQNTARYTRKWGGPPGHEVFTAPFNGGVE